MEPFHGLNLKGKTYLKLAFHTLQNTINQTEEKAMHKTIFEPLLILCHIGQVF